MSQGDFCCCRTKPVTGFQQFQQPGDAHGRTLWLPGPWIEVFHGGFPSHGGSPSHPLKYCRFKYIEIPGEPKP